MEMVWKLNDKPGAQATGCSDPSLALRACEEKRNMARVVAEEVTPLLGMDGGGIEVAAVEQGVVQVRLHGACACCPGSVQTVIMGIEEELRRRVPEVEYLEVVP
jgi:Fe-S cluster biogenesis protein NfuA